MKDLKELICELVAIESVNPDLVASGAGEGAIAGFVASWLERAGLEVEVVEPVPGRPSVVGVLRGTGGGQSLMLNAHMDTVGAGGMSDPFTPVVRDGRVYGRGAYDMKASLAAIMITAREAAELGLKGGLIVSAVADEEVASIGATAVLEHLRSTLPRLRGSGRRSRPMGPPEGQTVDYCIVTEPTELRLCLAHKGFVWLEVETTGVAAHGSRADLGVDAIAHMGSVLTRVLDLENTLRSGRRHPLLGTGSIHASLIEGGQELSTYPARCVVKIERRTIPGESAVSVLAEIEDTSPPRLPGRSGREAARVGTSPSVKLLMERPPSQLAADHPLTVAVSEAAGTPEQIGVAYWMDMALTNGAGIPTVAYGPIGEGAHADVEWVDLASVEKCVDVYLKVAQRLCN